MIDHYDQRLIGLKSDIHRRIVKFVNRFPTTHEWEVGPRRWEMQAFSALTGAASK